MLYQLSYTPADARCPLSCKFRFRNHLCVIPPTHLGNGAMLAGFAMRGIAMHSPALPLIPVEMLLLAYRSGIFPMADHRQDREIFWVEPRERAIIPLDALNVSRSLAKTVRQARFTVTIDQTFDRVMRACAAPRPDHPESWISERIIGSYHQLHLAGHAHSIECWQGGALVGGLYGVAFDQVFCGESMFSTASDASKVALCWLVVLMRRAGFTLLDCQFMTSHLQSLGARELPQADYIELLNAAMVPARASLPQTYREMMDAAGGDHSAAAKSIAQSLTQTS